MKKQTLSEEFKRMQKLAGIIIEAVEVPTWLKGKLEDVHTKPGQGSIFAKSIDNVLKLAQDALDKTKDIDKIANSTGTLTVNSPGIGYNLVLPMEQAKKLPGAKESEVEKTEGPSKIKVPAITTTAPLSQFKSDQLTVIVRPKKDDKGTIIPNEYIVLSAFPGDPSIPRASEWGGKYAVIIPGGKEALKEIEANEKWEEVFSGFEGYHRHIDDKAKKQIEQTLGISDKDIKITYIEAQEDRSNWFASVLINVNALPEDKKSNFKEIVKKITNSTKTDKESTPTDAPVTKKSGIVGKIKSFFGGKKTQQESIDLKLIDKVLNEYRRQLNENSEEDIFSYTPDKNNPNYKMWEEGEKNMNDGLIQGNYNLYQQGIEKQSEVFKKAGFSEKDIEEWSDSKSDSFDNY